MRLNRNKYRQWPEDEAKLKKDLKDINDAIELYKSKRLSLSVRNLLESAITKRHEIEGKLAVIDMEREKERREIERKKRKERKRLRELKRKQKELKNKQESKKY